MKKANNSTFKSNSFLCIVDYVECTCSCKGCKCIVSRLSALTAACTFKDLLITESSNHNRIWLFCSDSNWRFSPDPEWLKSPDANTIIEEIPAEYNILNPNAKAATNTKTGRKTTYYKNAADDVLWYVRVTGTFTYGNGSSKCTSATVSAESKNKTWKIASKSSSKSGSKAKATATAKQYLNGAPVGSVTKTVTLKCSSTGKLS